MEHRKGVILDITFNSSTVAHLQHTFWSPMMFSTMKSWCKSFVCNGRLNTIKSYDSFSINVLEAQLSQRGHVMLSVTENFANLVKVIQGHLKLHR